jgi:hypothetical protein
VLARPRKGYHHDMDLHPPDNTTDVDCALSKAVTGINPPPEIKCFKAGTTGRKTNQADQIDLTKFIFLQAIIVLMYLRTWLHRKLCLCENTTEWPNF